MLKSASNQYGSTSHKGSLNLFGGGTRCLTIDVCPDILLAAAALAGAAAFYALYTAISAKGRRRRRRRNDGGKTENQNLAESFPFFWDLVSSGRIILFSSRGRHVFVSRSLSISKIIFSDKLASNVVGR
jgi:hypothetical protein